MGSEPEFSFPVKAGRYSIACELNPAHRVLDLPSQWAHRESGLVQAITGNASEYQKWWVEEIPCAGGLYTIRSRLNGGRFVEPLRNAGLDGGAMQDGILLAFYPRNETPFQTWRFERHEPGESYYIRNEGSGKYWDLRDEDPSHIQQLSKKDIGHQRWLLLPVG